jgi:hypothetical protein
MAPNHTQSTPPQATGQGRVATITDIGKVLQRKRNTTAASEHDTAEMPVVPVYEPPLEPGEILGYFRHEGHCIQVQYSASECLWLRERPLGSEFIDLADFADFHELWYYELGQLTWPHRTLQFTYSGGDVEPKWLPMPSASLADLLYKVMSLYDYVAKGAMVRAANDLIPNPDPQRYDPNRKPR